MLQPRLQTVAATLARFPSRYAPLRANFTSRFDNFDKTVLGITKDSSTDTLVPDSDGPPPASPAKRTASNILLEAPRYRLYVQSTRNNTIVTIAKLNGGAVTTITAGALGFKGANKASYEAGYQCATKAIKRIKDIMEERRQNEEGTIMISLCLNGLGQGRDAVYRALLVADNDRVKTAVTDVTDITPIRCGGTKPKKQRRL